MRDVQTYDFGTFPNLGTPCSSERWKNKGFWFFEQLGIGDFRTLQNFRTETFFSATTLSLSTSKNC